MPHSINSPMAPHARKKYDNREVLQYPELLIGMGAIEGLDAFYVSGSNPSVGITFEDITAVGGTWVPLAAADTMSIVSTSAADTAAGTGAQLLLVTGVDANWLAIEEFVSMNGTTPVTTANSYLRINAVTVAVAGTGRVNAGVITIDDTTGAATQQSIPLGQALYSSTNFSIPAGKTGFLTNATINSVATKDIHWRFIVITEGLVRLVAVEGVISEAFTNIEVTPVFGVSEKSTILWEALATGPAPRVSGSFSILLMDNAEYNLP